MSFSGDFYFGNWNAPPSLALGNGDGDGGWNFDGNAGPDDYFNWDDWVTGILPNDNSIADNSFIDNPVIDNPVVGNSIPGNTLNGNTLNGNTLNPAIGTSATGSWVPGNSVQGWNSATGNYVIGNSVINNSIAGNSVTNNSIIGNSTTGNQVVGNPVVASAVVGNPVVASPVVGNPVVGNSATSNSIAGNSVTGNWVVGNSVTDNFHLATANQFVANPVVGPSVTGHPATANNAQLVSLMAAQQQAYAQRAYMAFQQQQRVIVTAQAQAAAQAQLQAAAQQQTPSALRAARRKRRAIAAAKAQAAAQLAAGQVPAAAASTSSAPSPSRPLLPHEIFPFMKLPQELQLMIYRYVWHTTPDTPPSGQFSYQQHLQFYSSPRHLRAQLRGLFKLGAISQEIRSVAYAEYFGRTQLYLRYDDFFRWNYSDSWHGSDQLTASMNLLWQDATLSPLLTEYVQHVAWHIGPVHNSKLCATERAALKWLQDCKNVKTLEIVVAMRSTHVRPKDVRDLLNARARFANGVVPYSTFKFFRYFKWSINRLDVLRKKGSLEKVVFSVEPFVNESTRVAERGTIDLEAMLERSEWFRKFKREALEHLLGPVPKKRKLGAKSEKKTEERSFYKIEQHLGHVNPKWHRSYKI
ncbi:hypothetical protein B0H65DRAFT_533043 [Neurospora tetraspora]|uniref:Uncharacterized protein n=1 Tax=Neurospora tetraspora TaxID=94610 RepID=A0AAE0MNM5_9PEZI|nr:hypothetical protein B0H65DRAFT_533043 [Neurospora tetraspora]